MDPSGGGAGLWPRRRSREAGGVGEGREEAAAPWRRRATREAPSEAPAPEVEENPWRLGSGAGRGGADRLWF